MIYQSQTKRLNSLQTISRNDVNEILVCEDLNDDMRSRYTVIVLDDHEYVRRFLTMYNEANYLPEDRNVEYFSSEGKYLIVFPYVRPRPLSSFYMGAYMQLSDAEEICQNLVVACMASGVPWPLLYLMLTQDQVNLSNDKSVHLSYMVDLTDLNENIIENDCVVACARILMSILEKKSEKKADSYVLLQKKIARESYNRFIELYRDIDLASTKHRKKGVIASIKAWFYRNKDILFRVVLVLSMLLFFFTLLSLLTNAIFGDVPWLRIFISSFNQIGLESLLQ